MIVVVRLHDFRGGLLLGCKDPAQHKMAQYDVGEELRIYAENAQGCEYQVGESIKRHNGVSVRLQFSERSKVLIVGLHHVPQQVLFVVRKLYVPRVGKVFYAGVLAAHSRKVADWCVDSGIDPSTVAFLGPVQFPKGSDVDGVQLKR